MYVSNEKSCIPKNFKIVKCICGDDFLLLPDLKEMNKVVEYHVKEHQRGSKGYKPKFMDGNYIRYVLIGQILKLASETEDQP